MRIPDSTVERIKLSFITIIANCGHHKGVYYDRNQDGDFALKNNQQVADLI